MKKKIRMVGLDLDGTLLNSQKEISAYTKEVIRRANEQGCIVLVSTGRPLTAVPQYILDVVGTKYALTTNGAVIHDMENDKVIWDNLLPVEQAVKAIEIFEAYDVLIEVFIDGIG